MWKIVDDVHVLCDAICVTCYHSFILAENTVQKGQGTCLMSKGHGVANPRPSVFSTNGLMHFTHVTLHQLFPE